MSGLWLQEVLAPEVLTQEASLGGTAELGAGSSVDYNAQTG